MFILNITHFLLLIMYSILFAIVFSLNNVLALDLEKLESFGISGDFYVSDIAVYFNRAFLAIPRTVCKNNVTNPTLVEVPWKEFNVILKTRMNNPIDGQIWTNCDHLQNAISLAKEGVKSKLWILDKGNEFCAPKIMVYGMLQNDFLAGERIELGEVPRDGLNSMVIENGTKLGDHRVFIANSGDNTILVCYLKDLQCNHLKFSEPRNPSFPISVDFLSISKVDPKMYVTGSQSVEVFVVEMADIPDEYSQKEETTTVNVSFCGEKLGPSSGLETDLKSGLIYFLLRDYAVVRWITDKPMQAEYHDVLAQTYKRLPYVSRIFTDPQGSVFALANPFGPSACPNQTSVAYKNTTKQLKKAKRLERTVKIMKYNWILDTFF